MDLRRIKNWARQISRFRTGDFLAVDGPNGTAKLPSEDLLEIISSSNSTDVIKWSDVQAVQDSDYSGLTARIAADIAAGIAPVVLDDVNGGATAILDNLNAGGALFRTSASCNERDVVYTDYVITDVAVSRTPYAKNLLFKNASNAYETDYNGFVEVSNNRNGVYTYTGSNSLDFLADFDSNSYVPSIRFSAVNPPNFAVKITSTAQTDGTVNVYKKENGIYTPLMPSVAGGATVEAGKTYQLTCVGDCWTLAEFEESTQGMFTVIGGRRYNVVKIGNLYWMAENLNYAFSGLQYTETSDSVPVANYYDRNDTLYGKYGFLYNGVAALYLNEHRAELGLGNWRLPSMDEWNSLLTTAGGSTKLKATTEWNSGYEGTDDFGFAALPGGGFTAEYTDPISGFQFNNVGELGGWWSSTVYEDQGSSPEYDGNIFNVNFWHNDVQSSYPAPRYAGYNVRLCMDAT